MTQATCEICRFWFKDKRGDEGNCQRFPPTVILIGMGNTPLGPQPAFTFAFPRIKSTFWCGEHQPRLMMQ